MIKFLYLHEVGGRSVTLAYERVLGTEPFQFRVALAVCRPASKTQPGDRFVKETGRNISSGRLRAGKGVFDVFPQGNERVTTAIIKELSVHGSGSDKVPQCVALLAQSYLASLEREELFEKSLLPLFTPSSSALS